MVDLTFATVAPVLGEAVLTVSSRVPRLVGMAAACVAVLGVAACGTDGGRSAVDLAVTPPTTPTTAATTAPTRLAKITSACQLLPAEVVVKILDSSGGSTVTARERPVENLANGKRRFGCLYGRDGREPFALTVSTRPDEAGRAGEAIDQIAKASGGETTRVDVLGADGVGYVDGKFRVPAVAVPYETELRMMVFAAPTVVPHGKLVEVAEYVVPQL